MEPSVLNWPCRTLFFLLLMTLLLPLRVSVIMAVGQDEQKITSGSNQSAFALALKAITLTQGEGGFELWRLKAEWANIQRQDDKIFLTNPRLTYFMREDDKVIYVQSDSGDVDQQEQLLRFIDNVRVTQDDTILIGPLLIYDGKTNTMTMPEGAELAATGVQGSYNHLVWFIDTKRIETMGDVVTHLASAVPEKGHTPPAVETVILE
jgi:LPS export ABC transporter protein LptC